MYITLRKNNSVLLKKHIKPASEHGKCANMHFIYRPLSLKGR